MKVIHINSTYNTGSTGRIVESIGKKVIENGDECYAAYGRASLPGKLKQIRIGNKLDQFHHLVRTRIFDTHGFHSTKVTTELIKKIDKIKPDIIHLHNLHGYYLDVRVLFEYLKTTQSKVIWSLHDCWAFTGHCCHFERVQCTKWKIGCFECPLKTYYPSSLIFDNSKNNYAIKKDLFNSVPVINFVTVSKWLENKVNQSFLSKHKITTIYNGVDTNIFKPGDQHSLKLKYGFNNKKIILGVANNWSSLKGLNSFFELSRLIKEDQIIVLVGLNKKQKRILPNNILGIEKSNNQLELAEYYNMTDVFVNPSIAETFSLVTVEAMSSGTPAIVYRTSALPELVDEQVGRIVETNNYEMLNKYVQDLIALGKSKYLDNCRQKALTLFDNKLTIDNYFKLYEQLVDNE